MNLKQHLLYGCLLIGIWSIPKGPALAQIQKLTIDEELLTGLIQAKQAELRTRALRILVRDDIEKSNLATYNTLNDLLDILLTEKNKTTLTRDLTIAAAEHAVAYAATWAFITDPNRCKQCYVKNGEKEGFKLPNAEGGAWEQLKAQVRSRKNSGAALAYASGKNEIYLLELQGWLLDTISYAFRDPNKHGLPEGLDKALRERGLFVRSKHRSWQGTVEDRYATFWKDRGVFRTALQLELDAFLKEIADDKWDWSELAKAVRYGDTTAVKELNLISLVGKKLGEEANEGGATENMKVKAVFELFRRAMDIYRYVNTEDRLITRLADIIDKYVITDPELFNKDSRFGFSIDVEAIILDMEDKLVDRGLSPTRNCFINIRPYFVIGVNYGAFRDNSLGFTAEENNGLSTIAWAGEKLGLRWRLWDWKYTRSQPVGHVFKYMGINRVRNVRPKDPAVSNMHLSVYASGLLYTIADLRSESSFDRPIVGAGLGFTLFNGLETTFSYVAPVLERTTVQKSIDAGFWNFGLDIPIFEYIRAAREKKALK